MAFSQIRNLDILFFTSFCIRGVVRGTHIKNYHIWLAHLRLEEGRRMYNKRISNRSMSLSCSRSQVKEWVAHIINFFLKSYICNGSCGFCVLLPKSRRFLGLFTNLIHRWRCNMFRNVKLHVLLINLSMKKKFGI